MTAAPTAPRLRVLFGPLAAALFFVGIVGLALLIPGYDQLRQTVSEIGEIGSPMQTPFTILLCAVGAAILVFAWGVSDFSREANVSRFPVFLIAYAGLAAAAMGVFSFPHPLHNLIGPTELIGYQAPGALAWAWRRRPNAKSIVRFSWIMFALLWLALALNIPGIVRTGSLWQAVSPLNGLLQRGLFAPFFVWCAGIGWLFRQMPIATNRSTTT
jgi:hypothetical membrane protein